MIIIILLIVAIISTKIYYSINKSKIIGKKGEAKVARILNSLGKNYRVFNDVYVKNRYGTSQIDHLVVSPYGIFVIETKNYKGHIWGGLNSERWVQNIFGNKHYLYNPIRQNFGHIKALRKALPRYCFNQYVSIIVFPSDSKLKVNVDDSYNVIYTNEIRSKIFEYEDEILTDEQQEDYILALQSFLGKGKVYKKTHAASVARKKERSRNLIKLGVCPHCGGQLVKRSGKYGSFYGCSNYPKCKFTFK